MVYIRDKVRCRNIRKKTGVKDIKDPRGNLEMGGTVVHVINNTSIQRIQRGS